LLQFISSAASGTSGGGVAYGAHIGGFIFGVIAILFFNRGEKKKPAGKVKIIKEPKNKNPWA
jgi:membrane associated rhomboid family serine protease